MKEYVVNIYQFLINVAKNNHQIESNSISFKCSNSKRMMKQLSFCLMNGRYSNSNSAMTFAISSANSYLHSESERIDGSLNYFLWGKKIVENVIRFTFFFSIHRFR